MYRYKDYSIDCAQLSMFYLRTETEFILQNIVFLNKNKTMGNFQKHNICVNVPLSQTLRSYLQTRAFLN
jgi:hypothetical protein